MPVGHHNNRKRLFSDEDAVNIRQFFYDHPDASIYVFARKLGVKDASIRTLIKGITYPNAGGPIQPDFFQHKAKPLVSSERVTDAFGWMLTGQEEEVAV